MFLAQIKEPSLAHLFKWQDWTVLVLYLIFTTIIGHIMKGKQASFRDFFLGGRTLPWPAVCGSIIATEISGVTFIGVAGGVLSANGDFTYMLWGIGSFIGRLIVALFFVKVFYEREIYSPYDYMGNQHGVALKRLATVFFTIGSILGQSVRVLVAALPLKVVTGIDFSFCIVIIGAFAILWTLMGGMRTVIWTDLVQFFLFTFGGSLALIWLIKSIPGGWSEYISVANESKKMNMWDARFGFHRDLVFTFWVAVFAVPFQNLTAFGVDQLNAQRMFCCKDARSAKLALIFSSLGQILTLLMLMVGAALFVYYKITPPAGAVAEVMAFDNNMIPADPDKVFPAWIVSALPVGLSGLILAGVFAAAITSLDSILAALSQTTISAVFGQKELQNEDKSKKYVLYSKILVVAWGIILTCFTLLLENVKNDVAILPLAFHMTTFTMGSMLAFFLASLWKVGSFHGLLLGSIISMVCAIFFLTDIWLIIFSFMENKGADSSLMNLLAKLPTYEIINGNKLASKWNYAWLWPLTCIITLGFGILIPSKKKPNLEK